MNKIWKQRLREFNFERAFFLTFAPYGFVSALYLLYKEWFSLDSEWFMDIHERAFFAFLGAGFGAGVLGQLVFGPYKNKKQQNEVAQNND